MGIYNFAERESGLRLRLLPYRHPVPISGYFTATMQKSTSNAPLRADPKIVSLIADLIGGRVRALFS